MPTTLEETTELRVAAESRTETAEPRRDATRYLDQDPTLYPEAVTHLLTPRRRRTVVTAETFALIRAECDKH